MRIGRINSQLRIDSRLQGKENVRLFGVGSFEVVVLLRTLYLGSYSGDRCYNGVACKRCVASEYAKCEGDTGTGVGGCVRRDVMIVWDGRGWML